MYKNFFEANYAISVDYVYISHHWNTVLLYCHLIHINRRKFIMFFMMFVKVNNLKFAFLI